MGKKVPFDRVNIEQREKFAGNVIQLNLQEGKESSFTNMLRSFHQKIIRKIS